MSVTEESPVYDMIIERGIEKGKREGKRENARVMFAKGYPVEDVAEITGLNMDELKKL